MTQIIQAKDINLRYLIDNFDIQLVLDDQFFREWQENLQELTDLDKQRKDSGLKKRNERRHRQVTRMGRDSLTEKSHY